MIEGSVFLNENDDVLYVINIPIFDSSRHREGATNGVR